MVNMGALDGNQAAKNIGIRPVAVGSGIALSALYRAAEFRESLKKHLSRIAAVLATACALVSGIAEAKSTVPAVNLETVSVAKTGAWMASFHDATNFAFSAGIPLVMLWSNKGCDKCNTLKASLIKPAFKTWQAEQPFVFCAVEGSDKKDLPSNKGAKEFALSGGDNGFKLKSYPYVTLIWKQADNVKAVTAFSGRKGEMGVPEEDELYQEFIGAIETAFAGYEKYSGGKFTVGNTVGDRLEAESATKWVDVLLYRDPLDELNVLEESLSISYPTGGVAKATVSRPLAWNKDETNKTVRIVFSELEGFSFSPGSTVDLAVLSVEGAVMEESLIALVARGNSPKNPLWIGARTSDTLNYGEWTMDLDVAQAKAQALSGDGARLLVSLGGSIWCPDCAKTDRNLIDTEEFKAWAIANKAVCFALDIPNLSASNPSGGPCLLNREKKNVSATYAAADPEGGMVQSGAGYLSRWMISDGEAAAVLARNCALVGKNTENGGWNRPERANQYRTGVPVFLLVDPFTLKVVSRIELFSSNSPANSDNLAGHLRRFDELFAVCNDPDVAHEDDNRDVSTATGVLAIGGEALDGVVSGGDITDVYKIEGVKFDERTTVTATVLNQPEVEWKLSIVQSFNGTNITAASVSGTGTLSVASDLVEADGSNVYAKVEITGLGRTAVSFGADKDATVLYSISAETAETQGTVGFGESSLSAFVPDAESFSVRVSRTGGRTGETVARVYLKDAGDAAEYDFPETNLTWSAGETGERVVSFSAWRPDNMLASGSFTIGLELTQGGDAVGTDECAVTLKDTDAPCFESFNLSFPAHLAFSYSGSIALMNVTPGVSAVLRKVSGALPKGMSLSYDKKTGTVVLKGTPKAAGEFTAAYTVKQNKTTGLPATITITVDDPKALNPYVGVKRAAQTMPLLEEIGEGTNVVAGMLTLSATAANKVTAKLLKPDGTSVSATGAWTGFDSASGEVSTEFAFKDGMEIALVMDTDGIIYASIDNGDYTCEFDKPEDADFEDWAGSYTVTFPEEDPLQDVEASMAVATMTISAKGVVKWSGTLANGQAVSGQSQLFGCDGDYAYVALFKGKKKYAFTSLLKIRRNGKDTWSDQTQNQIIHNANGVMTLEIDGETEFVRKAYGGWWNPNAATPDIAAAFGYGPELVLFAGESGEKGVLATKTGFSLVAPAKGEKLTYTKKTGLFGGFIVVPDLDGKSVKFTLKGVLLPGWDDCGCVEPEPGEEPLATRPFGAGTAYAKIKSGGVTTTVSFPVYLQVPAEVE